MFDTKSILKLKSRKNFVGNHKYEVCLKFLQKEVDIVVIIKKIKNIKEKLNKANENGSNKPSKDLKTINVAYL